MTSTYQIIAGSSGFRLAKENPACSKLPINHGSKILELVDLLRRYAGCMPGLLQISADDLWQEKDERDQTQQQPAMQEHVSQEISR